MSFPESGYWQETRDSYLGSETIKERKFKIGEVFDENKFKYIHQENEEYDERVHNGNAIYMPAMTIAQFNAMRKDPNIFYEIDTAMHWENYTLAVHLINRAGKAIFDQLDKDGLSLLMHSLQHSKVQNQFRPTKKFIALGADINLATERVCTNTYPFGVTPLWLALNLEYDLQAKPLENTHKIGLSILLLRHGALIPNSSDLSENGQALLQEALKQIFTPNEKLFVLGKLNDGNSLPHILVRDVYKNILHLSLQLDLVTT